jgi:hypothetical protein
MLMKRQNKLLFFLGVAEHWAKHTVHKLWVAWFLWKLAGKLVWRSIVHDLSKYGWTETKHFARTIRKLRNTIYGTNEYFALLEEIKPAIAHHYKHNQHHPEHFTNGIPDMGAIDQLEMICDWCAACKKHKDGNALHSAAINAQRFDYGPTKHLFYRKLLVDLSQASPADLTIDVEEHYETAQIQRPNNEPGSRSSDQPRFS